MWQITQTPIFIQQRWPAACFCSAGNGNSNTGATFRKQWKSHILTIQHRISKIAENSLVKLGIWLPYNSSLSRSMQPRQTYSPGFTNGRTDRKLRQAINPSAAMLRSGLKKGSHEMDEHMGFLFVSWWVIYGMRILSSHWCYTVSWNWGCVGWGGMYSSRLWWYKKNRTWLTLG